MPPAANTASSLLRDSRLHPLRQPILWLTLLYLVFELGFSARLLDVSSGNVAAAELRDIERVGRSLSGIALALALLPLLLRSRRLGRAGKLAGTLLLCGASILAMFWLQSRLVQYLADSLDGGERRNAVFLSVAAVALSNGEMQVARLDLGEAGAGSPSGKAFVAVFPALALSKPDLDQDATPVLRQLLMRRLTDGCDIGKPGCLGSAADFHDMIWLPLYMQIVDSYRIYSNAAQAYHAARRELPQRVQAAWQAHIAGRQDQKPDPLERAAFEQAVRARIEQDADNAAKRIMNDSFSADLPMNLVRFEEFFRHPAIQQKIRSALGVSDSGWVLPAVAREDDVRSRIFEPLLAPQIEAQLHSFRAPPAAYEDDGEYAALGREAADRVIVPPVALAFSLAGGLGHLFKFGFLLLALFWRPALPRGLIMGGLLACLVYIPLHLPNAVVESPAYPVLHRYATEGFSPAGAGLIEWVIRAQAFAYPCNEAIRRYVLNGLSFGYGGRQS